MRPLPLAIATRCLNRPLKSALVLAAEFGASGVQLDSRNELLPDSLSATGRRDLLHRVEELRLSIASLNFPLRRGLFDPDRLDARVSALKQAMDFASLLRCRVVTVRLGGRRDAGNERAADLPLAVLNDLCGHGNHVGVTLAIDPGIEEPADLLELLRQVSAGPIGINFDPMCPVAADRSPVDDVSAWRTFVSHVMVRDATRDFDGSASEVPVGRGQVPWEELLAVIYELNYRGWFCVERTRGDDRAGDASRAIQYVRSLEVG